MPEEEYNKYCNSAIRAAEDYDFEILTKKLEYIIELPN